MPYEEPLTAVDVAHFLVLPLAMQWQIILRGPLRPPSATPSYMRAAEALTHYRKLVVGPVPHGAGGAGLFGSVQYGSPEMFLHAASMAPPGPYPIAAPPGTLQYLFPHPGATGGAVTPAPRPTAPYQPQTPTW